MEELDLLKKSWNKNENYPKISEERIYAMLYKNSSSAVKWIFIISIIELVFGLVLNICMQFTKSYSENITLIKEAGLYYFYESFTVLMYAVIIYFIVKFYLVYQKVSTTDSVKQLMETIIKARQTVRNYIIFNLTSAAVFMIVIFSFVLHQTLIKQSLETHKQITIGIYLGSIAALLIIIGVVIGLFWLFYRLLYGFLLKRLKKNYNELQKIDY